MLQHRLHGLPAQTRFVSAMCLLLYSSGAHIQSVYRWMQRFVHRHRKGEERCTMIEQKLLFKEIHG